MSDVVVIGAGINGVAAALELSEAGLTVTLIDQYAPAAMASGWTLAGVRQSGRDAAELPLARAAIAQWPDLAERLGQKTFYRQEGNLRLARTEAEVEIIRQLVAHHASIGLPIQMLNNIDDIHQVSAAIGPEVLAASYCPSDGHADPHATVNGYVDAARRAGTVTLFWERVIAIDAAHGRVTGVQTDKRHIATGSVVVAAGVFGNKLLTPLGVAVQTEIQMVAVLRSVPMEKVLTPVVGVANADCAGRQEVDGRFRATSALMRWNGRISDVGRPMVYPTAASIAAVVKYFGGVVPAFKSAEIAEMWSGLIDMTPDGLPVIDAPSDIVDGLVIAMGFCGHGFGIAPVTGQIIASLVQKQAPSLDIGAFSLRRPAMHSGGRSHTTLFG